MSESRDHNSVSSSQDRSPAKRTTPAGRGRGPASGSGDGTSFASEQSAPSAHFASAAYSVRLLAHGPLTVDRVIGSHGSAPGQLNSPCGMCVWTDRSSIGAPPLIRELLVADCENHRVQSFDADSGRFLYAVGSQGTGDDQLQYPEDVCVTAEAAGDLMLVSDSANHRIVAYFRNLHWIATAFSSTHAHTPDRLLSAVVGRNVSALVTDLVAPGSWQFAYAFGTGGRTLPGQFNSPVGLCVSLGELFVCDSRNHRIQVFALTAPPPSAHGLRTLVPSLQFRREWPVSILRPEFVAVDPVEPVDEVIVTDASMGYVFAFTRDGRHDGPRLRRIGASGTRDGELAIPTAVLVCGSGDELLVADRDDRTHRISVFEPTTGRWMYHVPLPDGVCPRGLAMCADSSSVTLFVADMTHHRVLVLRSH